MTISAVFGCTGAVGHHILNILVASDAFPSIKTISRRTPKVESPKLEAIVETDSSKWTSRLTSLSPVPPTVYSAVGTTRATAGGIAAQWKIDHDLNVEIAKAAKEAGVQTFVFISSAGTRGFLSSYVPYSKMKIGVEDGIKALEFEQAIILRPGAILGERETPKAPLLESIFSSLGKISQGLQDKIAVDQVIIARAAVAAVKIAQEGKAPSKYWTVEQDEIIKLGRTEWKE